MAACKNAKGKASYSWCMHIMLTLGCGDNCLNISRGLKIKISIDLRSVKSQNIPSAFGRSWQTTRLKYTTHEIIITED